MDAVLATTAPAGQPDPAALRNGVTLLAVLALLAVILITCLTLILVLRRHRLGGASQRRGAKRDAPLDPWAEAGKRAPPADDDADDDDDNLGPPAG